MSNVWATVSTIVHPPRMFPPADFLFEKRIGLVSMNVVFEAKQPILLAVFRVVDEPVSSCVMVQFYVYVSK